MIPEQPRLSLHQILTQQTANPAQRQFYFLAYPASNLDLPTLQDLHMVKQLILQDQRWINVVERMAQRNFDLVFSFFHNDFVVYRAFIQECFAKKNRQGIDHIQLVLRSLMRPGIDSGISVQTIFKTLCGFLLECVRETDTDYVSSFFQNQPALFMLAYISQSKELSKCLTILVDKFVRFQRKNTVRINTPEFKQTYAEFNNLLTQVFMLYTSNPPNTSGDMMEVLCQLTKRYQMYDLHNDNISTLLQISQSGLAKFNRHARREISNDSEEVLHYQDDLIDAQESSTVQTQSAKLLQHLCKNIDGALVKLFRNAIETISGIFKSNQQSTSSEILQLRYLQLLVINKNLKNRKDLLEELTEFMGDYSEQIFQIGKESAVINYRLIRLIETFISVLPSKDFENILIFMLRSLDQTGNAGFVLQVYKSLNNLIQDKDIAGLMDSCMIVLTPHLLHLAARQPTIKYFQFLNNCLIQYQCLTERYCMKFLKAISDQVHLQIKQCWQNNSKGSLTVVRGYTCLTTIIRKKHILDDLYDEIEPILLEHSAYLENVNNILFENNILEIASIVVETGKQLTPFVISSLKCVKGVYQKNKDVDYIFELFYSICNSAKMSALGMPELVQFMVEISRRFFREQRREHMSTEVYNRGCLLLQILVQTFQDCFQGGAYRNTLIEELLSILYQQQSPTDQFKNILISLYYIRPFNLNLTFDGLTDRYSNKMRNLFLTVRVREYYSEQNLVELLGYLETYIRAYLLTGSKLQVELQDQLQMEMDTLKIPFRDINDIHLAQQVIKQLKQSKKIDLLQLSEQQLAVLDLITKVDWSGKKMRRIYKFVAV